MITPMLKKKKQEKKPMFFSTKPFRALCGTLVVKWVGMSVKTLVRRPPKASE